MRGIFLLLILSTTLLFAGKIFTYNQIHAMPRSVEKDYYIWRFISQKNTTPQEAKRIIQEASRINGKLQTAYRNKTGLTATLLPYKNTTPSFSVSTNTSQSNSFEKNKQQTLRKFIQQNKTNYPAWVKEGPQMECYLFNSCGTTLRRTKFNKTLDSREYRLLTMQKEFDTSIKLILKENLPALKRSLLQPPAAENQLTSQTHFRLGLFALKQNRTDLALIYFGQSRKNAQTRSDKDRANFWMYLITKNSGYLKNILQSNDINLYSLIVRDLYKLPYPKTVTPSLKYTNHSYYNIQDPIEWAKLKQKIFSRRFDLDLLADDYECQETIGHYCYIKEKATRYQTLYYPMPYRDILSRLPKKKQALIYAIVRQESRFIPASVSPSFALGMMQIMPFVVADISKKKNETIDLDEMFNPRKAIEYGSFHLDYLTSWLYHPLLVAYAYNGGIGYTKRLIKNRGKFLPGAYQPYLSMEEMENAETREYGKKVLTNYVIYMNKLGVPTRMLPLVKEVTNPYLSDRFRQ